MNFAAHGYASYFIFSTLDRHWRPNLSEAQALEIVKLCVKELKTRFLMHQPNWKVKVCDANGTREVAFDASAL
jgi:20S proteasome subunit beta 4